MIRRFLDALHVLIHGRPNEFHFGQGKVMYAAGVKDGKPFLVFSSRYHGPVGESGRIRVRRGDTILWLDPKVPLDTVDRFTKAVEELIENVEYQ
jgi:hypothetical protein